MTIVPSVHLVHADCRDILPTLSDAMLKAREASND